MILDGSGGDGGGGGSSSSGRLDQAALICRPEAYKDLLEHSKRAERITKPSAIRATPLRASPSSQREAARRARAAKVNAR